MQHCRNSLDLQQSTLSEVLYIFIVDLTTNKVFKIAMFYRLLLYHTLLANYYLGCVELLLLQFLLERPPVMPIVRS